MDTVLRRLRRRSLLAVPAVVAAATVMVRPAPASADAAPLECLADLFAAGLLTTEQLRES